MLGENEDFYVQSYIQTQSTGIACETLLTLKRRTASGLPGFRNKTCQTATQKHCYSFRGGFPNKNRISGGKIHDFQRGSFGKICIPGAKYYVNRVASTRGNSVKVAQFHGKTDLATLDSLIAEGGNYSNAGLSINPRGPAPRNVTSHCGENQNGRPSETELL